MKILISALTLTLMLAVAFCLSASAAGEITDGYYKYKVLDNGTVEITDYTGKEEEIIIPEEFDGKKVTKIGEWAFSGAPAEKIVLPSGTEHIDWFAFECCENLEEIAFNEGLKIIDVCAFAGCSALEELDFPESLEGFGWGALDDAADTIEELVIPGNVKSFNSGSVLESGEPGSKLATHQLLKEIVFEEGVEEIKFSNFHCTALKYVYVPASVKTLEVELLTDRAFEAIIYAGTSEQLSEVEFGSSLKKLIAEKKISIHIPSEHNTVTKKYEKPKCGGYGYTKGEYCETCKAYVSGHDVVVSYNKHEYKYLGYLGDGDPAESTKGASFEKDGWKQEMCIYCGDFRATTIPQVASVTLSTTEYVYDGKNKTPKVTLKDREGKVLVKGRDYILRTPSKRNGIGKHTVVIELIGDYEDISSVSFYILPATPDVEVTRTTSSVKLTWDKVAGATGYEIYRYNKSTDTYKKLKTTTETSYTDKELSAGTKYTYKVVSYKKLNNGNVYYCQKDEIINTATKTKTPSITVSSGSKTKATVKWNNVSGESGYQVWYSTSKDGTYKRFGNAKANATSLTVTGLTSGKTYYFKVRTYTKTDSGYVYGDYSSVKSVKVK